MPTLIPYKSLYLDNILVVPSIIKNLLSISSLAIFVILLSKSKTKVIVVSSLLVHGYNSELTEMAFVSFFFLNAELHIGHSY